MQHYFYPIKDLAADNKLTTGLPHKVPILYRWWFPEDSPVVAYLENYLAQHTEDIDMHYVYARLKRKELNNKTYYALYFGKSTIYLGFLNERVRYNNYVWLEASTIAPQTEYFNYKYTIKDAE